MCAFADDTANFQEDPSRNAIKPARGKKNLEDPPSPPLRKKAQARCWISNGKEEVKGKRRRARAEWQQEMRESERHGRTQRESNYLAASGCHEGI